MTGKACGPYIAHVPREGKPWRILHVFSSGRKGLVRPVAGTQKCSDGVIRNTVV